MEDGIAVGEVFREVAHTGVVKVPVVVGGIVVGHGERVGGWRVDWARSYGCGVCGVNVEVLVSGKKGSN